MTDEALEAILRSADLVYGAAAVDAALQSMSQMLGELLSDRRPVVLGVMTGAVVPLGQLLPRLKFNLELDYIHATRYHGSTSGRDVVWLARPQTPLRGRTVLVVDDILDEGHTLAAILRECRNEGARAVYSAVLVEKRHARRVSGLYADVVGLKVPDRYVFGAGMDYRGYFRNLPAIYALSAADED